MDAEREGTAMSLKPYGLIAPSVPLYPTYSPLRAPRNDIRPVIKFHGDHQIDGFCETCGEQATGLVIAGCLDAHIAEKEQCTRCLTYNWEQPTRSVWYACPEYGCILHIDQWHIMKGLCGSPNTPESAWRTREDA